MVGAAIVASCWVRRSQRVVIATGLTMRDNCGGWRERNGGEGRVTDGDTKGLGLTASWSRLKRLRGEDGEERFGWPGEGEQLVAGGRRQWLLIQLVCVSSNREERS